MEESIGIKFPLEIINGTLVTVSGEELVKSRILLYLTTLKNELIYNTKLGMPLSIFETKRNLQKDITIIEATLKAKLPYVDFEISGSLNNNGLAVLEIAYSYEGSNDAINLELELS